MENIEGIFSFKDIPKDEYLESGPNSEPGSGIQLALRLALKVLGQNTVIIANGEEGKKIGTTSLLPFFAVKKIKIPKNVEKNILVFDTEADINSMIDAIGKSKLIISCNHEDKKLLKMMVSSGVEYAATASIGYPLDFVNKVLASQEYNSAFIHLFAPSPSEYKILPSNTLELSRRIVNTGIFPLFEIKNGEWKLTIRFRTLEPIEVYYMSQGKTVKTDEELEREQRKININWKLVKEEKFWETS